MTDQIDDLIARAFAAVERRGIARAIFSLLPT